MRASDVSTRDPAEGRDRPLITRERLAELEAILERWVARRKARRAAERQREPRREVRR